NICEAKVDLFEKSENHDEPLLSLDEVVEKVLNGKLSLSNAIEIISANNG
ncbi:unnamed protein product, partial [marine sediment metagenome]